MFLRVVPTILFFLAPLVAQAQAPIPRIGVLIPELERSHSQAIKGLQEGFKQFGYRERKNIFLEIRNAKGDRSALQPAVEELVNQEVDVIFTTGTRATLIAKSATDKIPIVFIHPANPVPLGLVKSLEGPGANITGVTGFALQMTEKRLELFKEIVPGLRQIFVFYNVNNKFSRDNFTLSETAARNLGLGILSNGVKSVEEFKATFGRLQNEKGDAMFHVPDDLVESQADFVFEIARQKKLPTMFHEETWAIKGATAAYGPSYYEMGRQAAALVEMIIKGRKPETIPIQQVNKFDLMLNYRTASFIGLTLSRDLLARAHKVIR